MIWFFTFQVSILTNYFSGSLSTQNFRRCLNADSKNVTWDTPILTIIFNKFLAISTTPESWKTRYPEPRPFPRLALDKSEVLHTICNMPMKTYSSRISFCCPINLLRNELLTKRIKQFKKTLVFFLCPNIPWTMYSRTFLLAHSQHLLESVYLCTHAG